jgi:hypothetical protein
VRQAPDDRAFDAAGERIVAGVERIAAAQRHPATTKTIQLQATPDIPQVAVGDQRLIASQMRQMAGVIRPTPGQMRPRPDEMRRTPDRERPMAIHMQNVEYGHRLRPSSCIAIECCCAEQETSRSNGAGGRSHDSCANQ